MNTRRRKVIPVAIVAVLIAELAIGPRSIAFAEAPPAANAGPMTPGFSEQGPSLKAAAKPTKNKKAVEEVSPTGAIQQAIPIVTPLGRNGATPSLALVYSSDRAQNASAFGAGWDVPISAIGRSLRRGTPRIANDKYTNDTNFALFDRDGVELTPDVTSPTDGDRLVFRDHIDYTFTKSLFHEATPSYWQVQERDGTKSFYGNVPDQTVPEATRSDALGITSWLLVRRVDPFGNAIDYQYEAGTSAALNAQLDPLPSLIQYGKNLVTGAIHHAKVKFNYRSVPTQRLDNAHHTYLDRVADTIDVSVMTPGTQLVRTYLLDLQPSPSTSRYLLMSFQEKAADGELGPMTKFEYTRNDGVAGQICGSSFCPTSVTGFTPSASLASSMPRHVLRNYIVRTKSIDDTGIPWDRVYGIQDPDGQDRWPRAYFDRNNLTWDDYPFSAVASPFGFHFQDLDGDGGKDILYHPNFVSGYGLAQPWSTYLRNGTDAQGRPMFSSYADGRDLQITTRVDPLGMLDGASNYIDVDRDGAVDKVTFKPYIADAIEDAGKFGTTAGSGRPAFDWGNKNCLLWARIGPKVYPVPRSALPESFRAITDFSQFLSQPFHSLASPSSNSNACTPVVSDSERVAQAEIELSTFDAPTSIEIQAAPRASLDSLEPSTAVAYGPLQYNIARIEPSHLPDNCKRGPFGPLGPNPIDPRAYTLTRSGDLAVNMDRLRQIIEPQLIAMGVTLPEVDDGQRISPIMPTDDQNCPRDVVRLGGVPQMSPPPCVNIPNIGCVPIGHPFPSVGDIPGQQPRPFNINDFDPSVCFFHDFGPPGLINRPLWIKITHGTLGGDQTGLAGDTLLSNYPPIGGPTYAIDVMNDNTPTRVDRIRPIRDVFMPAVDLDRDGTPELVVLKSMVVDKTKNSAKVIMGAGVWRIVKYRAVTEGQYNSISHTHFSDTLNKILSTQRGQNTSRCPSLSMDGDYRCEALGRATCDRPNGGPGLTIATQRLLNIADWVTLFQDVNADGLPDLVIAKGATCYYGNDPTHKSTNHESGFDVFLNLGDRFDTTASTNIGFTQGPFNLVRNWSAGRLEGEFSVTDLSRFPFATLAFSDVDGDGISDAVLSAQAEWPTGRPGAGPTSWPTDPTACADDLQTRATPPRGDIVALPMNLSLVRCVWKGTGVGWRGAKEIAERLPPITHSAVNATISKASRVLNGALTDIDNFHEAFTTGNMSQLTDLNDDGMPDIVASLSAHVSDFQLVYPEMDPNRVHTNGSRRPDLLQAVDNGLGGQVLARYRSARLAEMTRASELPWVVDAISHRADAGFSEQGPADVVSFTYQGGLYDFSEREFLGFKVVEAKRPAFAADGTSLGTAVQRNEFYQAEASTTDARNPLKGLVKSATTSDEAGTLEVLRTEDAYELVPPSSGNIWRVRKTSSKELTCSEPQCLSNRARIENLTTFSDFDNYDNPRQEVVTATRSSVGDGFDGSIVIKHARTYQNNVIDWIIGLPATYARSFTSGDLPLASEAYLYDRNKLSRKTVARLGGDSSCAQSPAAFINTTVYNPDGTVYEVNNNNDTFVGGQQPRRTFVYDSATTSLPAEVSDYYVREGAAAVLTAKFTYDYRFGTVKTVEDPNGNITQTLRDSLNRPSVELSAEGQTLREYIYSWNLRPILTIAVTNPSTPTEFVQPIFERQHSDGAGRSLQTQVFDAIRSWKRYNTLGQVSESAAPFITGTEDYRKPSQIAAMSAPTTKLTADAYGREVRRLLPDARVKTTAYGVGRQTTVDARGTPRFHYLDALGRVVAADEAYRSPSQSGPFTPGTFTAIRTVVTRDGDGNITTAVDPELRSRSFTYDHQGRVTKAGTATGDYLYCYDGVGAETLSKTPDGRKVKTSRDEIGRVTAYTHEPAVQFGTDDVTFHYDSATASNGKGRLTSSNGSAGSIAFSYDVRGNVVSRNYTTQFGTLGTPFGDAAYSSTAGYDLIGRKLSETVPTDPVHATGATTVTYEYDERGLGRKVSVNETLVVDIDEVTASGKAKSAVYRDGSSDSWTYNAINDRLDSAQTTRGLLTLLSYGIQHDNNDNPLAVTRFFGTGPSNQSQDIVKAHTFDTLDRLATATYTGVDAQPRQFSYSYTASGNVSTKDGFTYHYDGTDRQAVSTRTKAAEGITQSFAYDTDGQLLSASPGSNGESWALSWDGGGRVRSVSTSVKLDPELPESTPTDLTFRYGPDGARVLKRVSGTRVVGGVAQNVSYSDVYIGNLELRGTHDAGASGSRAYFNVNFGGAHIQLAFDRTSNRALIRDPGADRYFHRDYLGSTALVTVGSGTVVSSQADQGRFEYAPYGEDLLSDGSARRIQRRYSGKDVDESGLSYFGARYLDPQLGRWTSRDPSALRDPSMGLTNSQSANLFAFADNNPVSNVDPDGKTAAAAADTLKEIAKEVIRAAKEAPVEVKAMIVEGAALAAPFVAAAVVGAAIGFAAVHGDGKGQFGTIDTQFLMKSKGGGSDKQVAASNEGTGSQSGSSTPSGKPEKPAGGGDTGSTTGNRPPNLSPPGAGRQGAFNEAKRANQIPTSQQPVRTGPNTDKNGNVQPGRTYEYEVPAAGGGTKTVRIRDDAAGHTYPDNPSQNRGPHFNDSKKRHYDY